jgi:hypothetical protein
MKTTFRTEWAFSAIRSITTSDDLVAIELSVQIGILVEAGCWRPEDG